MEPALPLDPEGPTIRMPSGWVRLPPRAEEVRLSDIAIVCGRLPHFNGCFPKGTVAPTVAEHSILVAHLVAFHLWPDGYPSPIVSLEEFRLAYLWALLHDAHEAYIGDLTRPLQRALGYIHEELLDKKGAPLETVTMRAVIKELKSRCDAAIRKSLELPRLTIDSLSVIGQADNEALSLTVKHVFNEDPIKWGFPAVDDNYSLIWESLDKVLLRKPNVGDYYEQCVITAVNAYRKARGE